MARNLMPKLHVTFVPMTEPLARTMVETWAYGGEYAIYDYSNEADHMMDPSGWGKGVFAVLSGEGELMGELSIEFYDENGRYTEYEDFGNEALINSREMWIGLGLRPDLTGRGWGAAFVSACVDFAVSHTRYRGDYVRLGVAEFNRRAIRAYEKAGFETFHRTTGEIAGQAVPCLHMRKRLQG
jgi:ribosomal-protein-alanine N-acetyltransferase